MAALSSSTGSTRPALAYASMTLLKSGETCIPLRAANASVVFTCSVSWSRALCIARASHADSDTMSEAVCVHGERSLTSFCCCRKSSAPERSSRSRICARSCLRSFASTVVSLDASPVLGRARMGGKPSRAASCSRESFCVVGCGDSSCRMSGKGEDTSS